MKEKFLLLFILIFPTAIFSQELPKTLSAEQVLELVRRFHPVVRQAKIEIEKSKAEILNARGNFDPSFNLYQTEKSFNGVDYYRNISPGFTIPTWYGLDVFAGTENLTGNRLDPTESKGESSFLGFNIPLAKNLLIDKRRAALRQAKIFNSMAAVEQQIMINDLFMEAVTAYWAWVKAYQTYVVIDKNVEINRRRFELIKKTIEFGERPAIDSIEASAQLQSFQYLKNESWLEFQNAGLELSAYLWAKNNQPYQLPEEVIVAVGWDSETSVSGFNTSLPDLLATAQKSHPYLKVYDYKLDILDIDKKLKFQDLLPKVDFSYNFLSTSHAIENTLLKASPFQNNFQYSLKVAVPLYLSQGRANYKIAKLKIEETKLAFAQNRLAIDLKIKSYFNAHVTLKKVMY